MSKEYNDYLYEHIGAVRNAAAWMADNLGIVRDMTSVEQDAFDYAAQLHDESKWGVVEYGPYDAYFYGERDEDVFSRAWLHHIHNNKHHWQHWVLVNGYGKFGDPGVVTALEMPKTYALEMVADWWSFSWRTGNLEEVFDWYEDHRDKIVLHEETRKFVEAVLDEIREKLQAEGELYE